MAEMIIDIWLYGILARYGGDPEQRTFANLKVTMPPESTLDDLLKRLGMKTEERGITFINGDLSAMPGLQPDLEHLLKDGDRVAFFHLQSMWPFQYRHGVGMIDEMRRAMDESDDHGLRNAYQKPEGN